MANGNDFKGGSPWGSPPGGGGNGSGRGGQRPPSIDEVIEKNDLTSEKIAIGGFSQGCMISLQTGIKRKDKINSVIGYSGKIIDENHLQDNINSNPNIIYLSN